VNARGCGSRDNAATVSKHGAKLLSADRLALGVYQTMSVVATSIDV
jgi:hypothetical protein